MRQFLYGLLILGLLSGCFCHPDPSYQTDLCCTDLGEQVEGAVVSDSFCEGEWPSEAWWECFEDEQLNRLIGVSLQCNPDIKIAEARMSEACFLAGEKRSTLFPQLYLLGDLQRRKVSKFGSEVPGELGVFTEATLAPFAFYELDLWKKNRSLYYAELGNAMASMAEREEAKLLLATSIANIYIDLQMLYVRIGIAKERLEDRKELYGLLHQLFDRGVISEYRLYETDGQTAMVQDLIAQLEGEVQLDLHALAALVGNPAACCGLDGDVKVCPSAQFSGSVPMPACLPLDLIARRPDIVAQKWYIESACYETKAAKARFYPSINLLSYVGVQSFVLSQLFTDRAMIALGEVAGILPIFTAGKLRAQLGVAQKSLDIAIENYNQTIYTAIQQVSDGITNLQTADRQIREIRRSLEDSEELYRLTRLRYEQGLEAKISVLNALNNVLIQKDLEAIAQLSRFQSIVEVIRSVGGGYDVRCDTC